MNQETKSGLKAAGTTALLGGAVLITIGNPVAWAALAVATVQIGKAAYQNSKHEQKQLHADQDRVI